MGNYDNMLEPIRIGTHTWKNRVVKGPSSTLFFGPDQYCNDVVIGPYEAMAKGGAAAVIIGAMLSDDPKNLIEAETGDVYPYGYRGYPFGGLYDDKFIPGLTKLTDAVHQYGCEIIAQIFQNGAALETKGGAWCSSTLPADQLPSPVPACFPTRGLSVEEIHAFEDRYVDAAERAKKAGFDGCEVHCANGYFILSFASRVWNHRDDEYGCQSIENRTRLARELIARVKERCGEDFIVGVRINGQEFGHPDAITLEEGAQIAQAMEAAGADYISVTGYGYGPNPMQYADDFWMTPEATDDMKRFENRAEDGIVVEAAANVKRNVNVPVFGIGTLTPESAEKFIEEGRFDLGLFARGLWADPEIANKLAQGRPEDIRRCTRCGTCEDLTDVPQHRRRCRVNPAFSYEVERSITPAETKKKVLVVGGGVAGMQCARVLAERGHDVELCEQRSSLAVTLNIATMVKGTACEKVPYLIDWLVEQVRKHPNIKVSLKTEVTPTYVKKAAPDAVVVATGGRYAVPDVPGIDSKIVQTVPGLEKMAEKPLKLLGANAINKLSKIALPTIGKECVVLGAQIEGIQGAVFLASRGKNVTVLETAEETAARMPFRYAERDLPWLQRRGVDIVTGVSLGRIDKKGVSYSKEGRQHRIACDSVLVFMSPVEDKGLYEQVKDLAPEVYAIGACNGTDESLMVDAMREGLLVGLAI